jgi:uncharacterized protein YukE
MTTKEREKLVAKNVTAMRANKRRFQTRLQEAKRYREKIADRFAILSKFFEVEEERFAVLDAIEDFESGVRQQLTHIDGEIQKLEKGLKALNETKQGKLRTAFLEFIIDDTTLSLKNIALACYEYDRIMESVKEIEKTT